MYRQYGSLAFSARQSFDCVIYSFSRAIRACKTRSTSKTQECLSFLFAKSCSIKATSERPSMVKCNFGTTKILGSVSGNRFSWSSSVVRWDNASSFWLLTADLQIPSIWNFNTLVTFERMLQGRVQLPVSPLCVVMPVNREFRDLHIRSQPWNGTQGCQMYFQILQYVISTSPWINNQWTISLSYPSGCHGIEIDGICWSQKSVSSIFLPSSERSLRMRKTTATRWD